MPAATARCFAAACFAERFRVRESVDVAFGWNLLGAVAGGLIEFFSMLVGIHAMALVALLAYAVAPTSAAEFPAYVRATLDRLLLHLTPVAALILALALSGLAPDPAATISAAALDGRDVACADALDIFVRCYGAEAGKLAFGTRHVRFGTDRAIYRPGDAITPRRGANAIWDGYKMGMRL